jgi:putative GTP pyrophosphokinase
VARIRRLGMVPITRPAKSTRSIVDKLQRESVRLSQMQDLAGWRVVVTDLQAQDQAVAALSLEFPGAAIIDRRDRPSHGYRAVHVMVRALGKVVEIQVRTGLQHLWAQVSEAAALRIDPALKYGGGPPTIRNCFRGISRPWSACTRRRPHSRPRRLEPVRSEPS